MPELSAHTRPLFLVHLPTLQTDEEERKSSGCRCAHSEAATNCNRLKHRNRATGGMSSGHSVVTDSTGLVEIPAKEEPDAIGNPHV
jgi:hypothetical protein